MKKLALACMGDVTSPILWSGTTRKMWDQFIEKGVFEMSKLEDSFYPSPFRRKIMNLYSKPFYYGGVHDFLVEKEWNKQLAPTICGSGVDYILYLAEYFYSNDFPSNLKYYAYIDSEKVYWSKFMLKRFKPLYGLYSRNYKKNLLNVLEHQSIVFTQNEWTRRELIQSYQVPAEKVINVHFGVNCTFLDEEKDYSKNLLLIILHKGRERYKGLKLLLKAFPCVRKSIPNARLAIVGTDYGQEVEGVECYYNQPRSKTLELLKECTLYTMPSLSEPNGITFLEGLANKAPIVGLNRFAFPEFAGCNEERGFIVEHADANELANTIIRALEDKEKLKLMGENGYKYVRLNFDWSLVVDKITEAIIKDNE